MVVCGARGTPSLPLPYLVCCLQVIFSDVVTKINRKDKPQERILVVTDKAVYNLNRAKKCKRRIDITKVDAITVSTMSDEWAIHVTDEYDYRISCARKAEATECIVSSRFDATGDTVRVTLSSQLDLKGVVATRLAKKPSPGDAVGAAGVPSSGAEAAGGSAASATPRGAAGGPPTSPTRQASLSTAVGELGPIDEGDEDSD